MAKKPNEIEPLDLLRGSMDAMLHAIQEEDWTAADKHLDRAHKIAIVSIASDFRIFLNKMEKKS